MDYGPRFNVLPKKNLSCPCQLNHRSMSGAGKTRYPLDTYPPYIEGAAYLLSRRIAAYIHRNLNDLGVSVDSSIVLRHYIFSLVLYAILVTGWRTFTRYLNVVPTSSNIVWYELSLIRNQESVQKWSYCKPSLRGPRYLAQLRMSRWQFGSLASRCTPLTRPSLSHGM